ncbi:acyltransferase family protein [Streptacidiphilus sp. 4-A2]|nr:acyltransferase family protein [Streptacidiphilus sp. 4-A2]
MLDSRSAVFESMMILATMFTGTAIQRAEAGQIRVRSAVVCCVLVFAAGLASGAVYGSSSLNEIWTASATSWCTAFAAAWLVFGVGLLLRRRRIPRPLCRLGVLSYAVYLVHIPLLAAVQWGFTDIGFARTGGWAGNCCAPAASWRWCCCSPRRCTGWWSCPVNGSADGCWSGPATAPPTARPAARRTAPPMARPTARPTARPATKGRLTLQVRGLVRQYCLAGGVPPNGLTSIT